MARRATGEGIQTQRRNIDSAKLYREIIDTTGRVEYHTDRDRNREAIQTEMRKQKKKSQKHHEGSTRHTPGDIARW